jgi:hypothetical protein
MFVFGLENLDVVSPWGNSFVYLLFLSFLNVKLTAARWFCSDQKIHLQQTKIWWGMDSSIPYDDLLLSFSQKCRNESKLMSQVTFDHDLPQAIHFMSQINVHQDMRFSLCQEKCYLSLCLWNWTVKNLTSHVGHWRVIRFLKCFHQVHCHFKLCLPSVENLHFQA